MHYDLVLFDLDGTLLGSDRTIRESTLRSLRALMDRGVRVGFATGRAPASIRTYAEKLQPTGPHILFNGCLLWDAAADEPRAGHTLPREDALRLVETTIDLGVHANVYVGDKLYVRNRGEISYASEEKDGVPHTEVPNLLEWLSEREDAPFKLLCIDESANFGPLVERFRGVLASDCTIVNSEPTYLEVLPPGVSKGAMVHAIEMHYGIPAERIVAFGDELNDVELLQRVGHAVVMGNANPELFPLADTVIGRNDGDAISDYLPTLFGKL